MDHAGPRDLDGSGGHRVAVRNASLAHATVDALP